MVGDLEALQYQQEQLANAVGALMSLTRTPQERLDRALSYFTRTFRNEPTGHAFTLWRRIYEAIGDPPVGTTIGIRIDLLTAAELDTIATALFELQMEIANACWETGAGASSAQPSPESR